ncbi:MAG: hypothetical protein DWQ04_25620, partial [Chloroflexi bacterium]
MTNQNGNGNRNRNGRFFHRFEPGLSLEEQEARRRREDRIRTLLNDEDEMLGKAYDGRLVRRLLQFV